MVFPFSDCFKQISLRGSVSSAITNLWILLGLAFPTPYLSKAWVGRTILG